MADKSNSKKSSRRSAVTVRERSESENSAKPKRQLVRRSAAGASKPFKVIGKFIAKLFRPLKFLLKPFQARPVRFIGRLLAKILLINYFYNSWKELKKVTWPNRKETWQLTISVFMFSIIFGVLISITDYGLDKIFKKIILK